MSRLHLAINCIGNNMSNIAIAIAAIAFTFSQHGAAFFFLSMSAAMSASMYVTKNNSGYVPLDCYRGAVSSNAVLVDELTKAYDIIHEIERQLEEKSKEKINREEK